MTSDEKISIGINNIQMTCRRSQFSYLRPAFIFEHFFLQIK